MSTNLHTHNYLIEDCVVRQAVGFILKIKMPSKLYRTKISDLLIASLSNNIDELYFVLLFF